MGKIFSVFNHKGGVGKTTLVHNVGVAMAQSGKNVLFVDADPQMNLTAAYFGLSDSVDYAVSDSNSMNANQNEWVETIEPNLSISEAITASMSASSPPNSNFSRRSEGEGSVSILRGAVELATLEVDMSLSIATKSNIQASQVLRVQEFFNNLSEQYDCVIIDTPPSAGSAITAVLVRLSHYLITPVSPSFFSLQAIDNLKPIFQAWNQQFSWISGFSDRVQFLGTVVQMAKRYTGGSNQTGFSAATMEWVKTLNSRARPFQQWMMGIGRSISEEDFIRIFPDRTPFVAEICCDFTPQLRGISERAGVPVINLTQDLCNKYKPTGAAVDIVSNSQGQYKISFDKINEQYRDLAQNLLPLLP